MPNLEDLQMELIEVREAIDMAETALEFKEDKSLRQRVVELKLEEAILSSRIKEWTL